MQVATNRGKSGQPRRVQPHSARAMSTAARQEQQQLLRTTPSKAAALASLSGSQSPSGIAESVSPEVYRKLPLLCSEELHVYERHNSQPLKPESQQALASMASSMIPSGMQPQPSPEKIRDAVDNGEGDEGDECDDEPEADSLDPAEVIEVRLAANYEDDGEGQIATNDRKRVAGAVTDECIAIFWEKIQRLTWNRYCVKRFEVGKMYAGFVFYGVYRAGKFVVDDSKKFRPGSVVVLNTDIEGFNKPQPQEPGLIHPQVFNKIFNLERYPPDLVGEAFAFGPAGSFDSGIERRKLIYNGGGSEWLLDGVEIRFNSSFNSSSAHGRHRPCRDESRQMNASMKDRLTEFLRQSNKWRQPNPTAASSRRVNGPEAETARPQPKAKKTTTKTYVPKKAPAPAHDDAAPASTTGLHAQANLSAELKAPAAMKPSAKQTASNRRSSRLSTGGTDSDAQAKPASPSSATQAAKKKSPRKPAAKKRPASTHRDVGADTKPAAK